MKISEMLIGNLLIIALLIIVGPVAGNCQEGDGSSESIGKKSAQIKILDPKDGDKVGFSAVVSGMTSIPESAVYVLVHPLSTNLWWVQRHPSPANLDGSWRTLCYFGTNTRGMGESFEVVAVSTNKVLAEGQTITQIPNSFIRSDIIMVIREN